MRRVVALAGVVGIAGALLAAPAAAVQAPHDVVVAAKPEGNTPHALDKSVRAITKVGNRIVVGGNFTKIRSASSTTEIARPYVFAYDPATGAIDDNFAPKLNGMVHAIAAGPNNTVFLGGEFKSVNGQTRNRVAKLDLATGALVSEFKLGANSKVTDLKVSGSRLYLGGTFSALKGVTRSRLAAADVMTGKLDPDVVFTFSDPNTDKNGKGVLGVSKFDVTPDGRRLVALGNFRKVDGLEREQVVQLNVGRRPAVVDNWHTSAYRTRDDKGGSWCSSTFASYVRDVDINSDGSYMVIATTGGYRANRLCDTAARWELGVTGSNLAPRWVDFTGGDTLWSAGVTGEAVYVGGHQRWMNNPFAGDQAGPGAVPRSGIAALHPVNGLPLSWNPGRKRGVGAFELTGTPEQLLVGSDTDRFAGFYRGRLAALATSKGTAIPPASSGPLPGDLYAVSAGSGATITKRSFDGSSVGSATTVSGGGVDWSQARGGFMLSGTLYTGWSDGKLYRRAFDGTTFGTAAELNLYGLTNTHFPLASVTGMAHDEYSGRLYYTVANQSRLYYRYFTAESDVVGAETFLASGNITGLDWRNVTGMHLHGNTLYYGSKDGSLRKVAFNDGFPAGSITVVSNDGTWNNRALFLYAGAGYEAPNRAPTARIIVDCNATTCRFGSTGSRDVDGRVAGYSWRFGDGATATGPGPDHTYASGGSYTVTLTVTDDRGATGSTSVTLNL